jgi:hypothetical protein
MLELNFNFQERYIVEKYLVDVELGHKIVEALRPGVQINTMEHFLNIDDLAVMRFEDLSDSQKKRFLINTFKQIGKEYDFNFDVDTQDKIVCSEIAYIAFDDIEWETEKKVGRFTISPDNVANKIKSKQYNISIPVLIHKGKDIKRDIEQNFLRLLEGDYESITF